MSMASPRKQAIEVYEEALKKARQIPDEGKEGMLLINTGKAHFDLGEYAKAAELFEGALAILRRVRGEDHPHTKTAARNLAAAKRLSCP